MKKLLSILILANIVFFVNAQSAIEIPAYACVGNILYVDYDPVDMIKFSVSFDGKYLMEDYDANTKRISIISVNETDSYRNLKIMINYDGKRLKTASCKIYQKKIEPFAMEGSWLVSSLGENNYKYDKQTTMAAHDWKITPSNAATITLKRGNLLTLDWKDDYHGQVVLKAYAYGCNTETSELDITVEAPVAKCETPSGAIKLCQNSSKTTYTVAKNVRATSYIWAIKPSSAGTITGNGTSAVVNWDKDFYGVAYISVAGKNTNGTGPYSDSKVVSVNPFPRTPAKPSGSTSMCQNSGNSTYTIPNTSFALNYTWYIEPSSAGTITGTGTTAILDLAENYSGTASISVKSNNSCGSSSKSTALDVEILPLPKKPSGIVGSTIVCYASQKVTYNIDALTNATSYEWELLPTNAGTVTNKGTSSSIDFSSSFSGTATLKVRGVSCGYGEWSDELSIEVLPGLEIPNAPVGDYELCQNPNNKTYSTGAVSNATGYIWTIDPGTAGVLDNNGTSVTIDWQSSFTGTASLTVRATNGCETTPSSTALDISIAELPGTVSQPSGATSICNGTEKSLYSILSVANATGYEWYIEPSTAGTIASSGIFATVSWSASFNGYASIKARAVNECGNGNYSAPLQVLINPLPSKASTPIFSGNVCQGDNSVVFSSIEVSNASSFEWELLPANAGTVTNNGTRSSIDFSSSFSGTATLKVRGISCGYGEWSDELSIDVIPNISKPSIPSGDVVICQGTSSTGYSIIKVSEALNYTWELLPSESGYVSVDGHSASVYWNTSFIGDASLSVTVSNTCGTKQSDSKIEILPTPQNISALYAEGTFCQGESIELYSDSSSYATNYEWSVLPEGAGSFKSSAINRDVTFNPSSDFVGSLYFTAKGINSCGKGHESAAKQVIIFAKPDNPIIDTKDLYCFNEQIILNVSNKEGLAINWFDEQNKLLSQYDTLNLINPESTKYYVSKIGNNGCNSDLTEVELSISEEVFADFEVSKPEIRVGEAVQFYNRSTGAFTYLWDFSEGDGSTKENPWHYFYEEGYYDITLFVTSSEGCKDTLVVKNAAHVTKHNTGIDNNNEDAVLIYPLPITNKLIVKTESKGYTFTMYSATGTIMIIEPLEKNTNTIDVSWLKPGAYIIKIVGPKGMVISKTVVKV